MENFEDINQGDKVLHGSFVRTVKRVTRNYIILDNNNVFRRKDGVAPMKYVGYFPYIVKADSELIGYIEECNKRNNLISKIRDYPLDKLSTEELEKVYELIPK